MRDLRTMTLAELRALARKRLGPGRADLRTKAALVAALERAARAEKRPAQKVRKRVGTPTRVPRAGKDARRTRKPRAAAKKGPAAKRAPRAARKAPAPVVADAALDPAGFFVARVRGEDAVREAPHPMSEAAEGAPPAAARRAPSPEDLGELPWSYGEDMLVVLPRDPRSLFVYWDHSEATLRDAFRGLDAPRVELVLSARAGEGWEPVRRVPLALESRGWYVHDIDAGRTYRAELRVVDDAGRERLLGPRSGAAAVPPAGPSPAVDDRFVHLPWDRPLGPALGEGHRRAELPEEAREDLARLSTWSGEGEAGSGAMRPWSPGAGPRRPGEGE